MSIRIKESAFEKFFDLNARKNFWAINKNQEFSEILGKKKKPKKKIHLKNYKKFYFWSVFVQKQFLMYLKL